MTNVGIILDSIYCDNIYTVETSDIERIHHATIMNYTPIIWILCEIKKLKLRLIFATLDIVINELNYNNWNLYL